MARKRHPPNFYCVTTLPSKTNTVKATVFSEKTMALNSLLCADVPLSNYSLGKNGVSVF